MTERLPFHFSLSFTGEGNGNPLWCSCLENPRDGGAWWAAVYGVTQSQTRLKWLSSSSSSSRTRPPSHWAIVCTGWDWPQPETLRWGWDLGVAKQTHPSSWMILLAVGWTCDPEWANEGLCWGFGCIWWEGTVCYGGKSAGLVGRKLGAAGGHLGHPPVETNCLRVKPRHGERSSHDWVVGVPGCSWVRNPVHPTLIPWDNKFSFFT